MIQSLRFSNPDRPSRYIPRLFNAVSQTALAQWYSLPYNACLARVTAYLRRNTGRMAERLSLFGLAHVRRAFQPLSDMRRTPATFWSFSDIFGLVKRPALAESGPAAFGRFT
jgi:hypothetical protein